MWRARLTMRLGSCFLCLALFLAFSGGWRRKLEPSNSSLPQPVLKLPRSGARDLQAILPRVKTSRPPESVARGRKNLERLPLSFEPNLGQTDGSVKFLSRGAGYTVFLTPDRAVLRFEQHRNRKGRAPLENKRWLEYPAPSAAQARASLEMKLHGSNPAPKLVPHERLPGKSNYFIGNDPTQWRINVAHYAKVSLQDVFPNVDLAYYGNQHQLEYDFLVHPGGDPRLIRLAFSGQRKLRIGNRGDLIVQVGESTVRFRKPVIYQNGTDGRSSRRWIDGGYVLAGHDTVGFEVADYDHDKILVIDPVLSYSTFLGGGSLDVGNGIAVDASGSAYITGETASVDFPPTPGAYQTVNAGASDAFVTKLDPTGASLVYSTYIGGELSERGTSIAVDANGKASITGRTNSLGFPMMHPWQSQLLGDFDAFVSQLSPQGDALLFSTYLGGSGNDEGSGIAVDSAGNIYVTGGASATSGDDFPTTQGAFQRLYGGGMNDAFVTKFDPTKSGPAAIVYSTFLGGGGVDRGDSIAVDTNGNAYITGRTASSDFPKRNPLQADFAGGVYDAFVTELNSSGSDLVFSTFLGGSGTDQGYGIALDSSSNVYVVGVTSSSNFPTSASAYQTANAGGSDVFLAELGASGSSLLYSTYLGGSGTDTGVGIAIDSSSMALITGRTSSATSFPVTPNAIQQGFGGGPNDAFVAKINPTKAGAESLVYSSYLGGANDEDIPSPGQAGNPSGAITVDPFGNAYITGNTSSPNFPNLNSYQASYGGNPSDAFVVKLSFTDSGSQSFSLGVNLGSQTTIPGGSADYTITAFPSGGFTGSITLSVSGLPDSAMASFAPTTITITDASQKSAKLSVSTDPATPEGSYQVSVMGSNGTLQPSVSFTLNVSSPTGSADLSITKTGSPNPVTVNTTLTYSINVTNQGPGSATGVTVTDTLPSTLTSAQITTTRGSCSLGPPALCNLGILGTGEGAAVTISGKPSTAGQIANSVQVSGDQSDPNPDNNSATATNLVEVAGTGSPAMLDPSLQVSAVITGLNEPTGIAFLGPNDFLVIEKSPKSDSQDANVLRIAGGVASTILQLPVNSAVERGLLGITLHPNFPATPYIYLYWTCRGPEAGDHCDAKAGSATDVSKVPLRGNRVDRFLWDGTTLSFDMNLITLHSYQADEGQPLRGNHNGGKIAFGPDGKLYILIGDNGRRGNMQNVQFGTYSDGIHDDQFGGPDPDNNHLTGVILRLNEDGSTPADNPFYASGASIGGEDGANIQKIYAYGVRNSFGMAFDPMSGNLWNEENGDDSFDEINLIPPGANNGWVQVMGPLNRVSDFKAIETSPKYFGLQQIRWSPLLIADTPDAALANMFMLDGAVYNDPKFSWKYAVAPSPIGFAGPALGSFAGDLFVGAARTFLEGGYLFHFKLTGDRSDLDLTGDPRLADRVADNTDKFDVNESESLLIGRDFGITTDIETGPDGNLFVVSLSNSSGASSSGGVYEISKSPSAITAVPTVLEREHFAKYR